MRGELTVITGSMFGGKTTALIDRIERSNNPVNYKPDRDTRQVHILTHTGKMSQSINCKYLPPIEPPSPDAAFFIDEAHFFDVALHDVVHTWLDLGHDVTVAGLSSDAMCRPFETMAMLLAMADIIIQCKADCAVCGRPAAHSHRKTNSKDKFAVGGADMYEPRCNRCMNGKKEIQANP